MARKHKDIINSLGKRVVTYNWTQDAINCYNRGCNCRGCFYENFFSKWDDNYCSERQSPKHCKLKVAVLELVRVLGTPKKEINTDNMSPLMISIAEDLSPSEFKLLKFFIKGFSLEEVAGFLEISVNTAKTIRGKVVVKSAKFVDLGIDKRKKFENLMDILKETDGELCNN